LRNKKNTICNGKNININPSFIKKKYSVYNKIYFACVPFFCWLEQQMLLFGIELLLNTYFFERRWPLLRHRSTIFYVGFKKQIICVVVGNGKRTTNIIRQGGDTKCDKVYDFFYVWNTQVGEKSSMGK
jgi:hypothetical protein